MLPTKKMPDSFPTTRLCAPQVGLNSETSGKDNDHNPWLMYHSTAPTTVIQTSLEDCSLFLVVSTISLNDQVLSSSLSTSFKAFFT